MHILLNWLTKAVGNEKKKEGLLYFFTEVVTKKKVFEMLETIWSMDEYFIEIIKSFHTLSLSEANLPTYQLSQDEWHRKNTKNEFS